MTMRLLPQLVLTADDEPAHPARKLVQVVLLTAFRESATELRFEPQENRIRLTLHVEGTDYEMVPPPAFLARRISQIFKALAGLDICKNRQRQTGSVQLLIGSEAARLEVAIEPTAHGESVLVSIHDSTIVPAEAVQTLQAWGMGSDDDFIEFIEFVEE